MEIRELIEIQDLLSSFLGKPKNEVSIDYQLQYNCPHCAEENNGIPDGKYNLEVNIVKGVYHCWRCESSGEDMHGSLRRLIKRYGGRDAVLTYERLIQQIRNNRMYKLPEFDNILSIIDENTPVLPKTFKKIDLKTCPYRLKKYLEKRKIGQDLIDKFGLGYTNDMEEKPSYRYRLIIPSYDENGVLQFWTGRDYTGNDKRVKYCNIQGVKKNEITYLRSKLNMDCDIYIAEGALDAVLGPPNCTALLGKVLKKGDELYQDLYNHANANIIIVLDGDTKIEETKRIYSLFDRGKTKGRVRYIRMNNYKDFGDAHTEGGNKAVIDILKQEKKFSEFELVI